MRSNHSPIGGTTGNGNFEFTGQKLKLGVVGGPLSNEFSIRPWISDLVESRAGKLVSGHIANGIATSLYRVHIDVGQCL